MLDSCAFAAHPPTLPTQPRKRGWVGGVWRCTRLGAALEQCSVTFRAVKAGCSTPTHPLTPPTHRWSTLPVGGITLSGGVGGYVVATPYPLDAWGG